MLFFLGKGHFFYRGQVEDSATAEISRSQVGLGLNDPASTSIQHRGFTLDIIEILAKSDWSEQSSKLKPALSYCVTVAFLWGITFCKDKLSTKKAYTP